MLKGFFAKNLLPITVFLTGACVLVIEVAATRVLSPYFGNTIYSVSSIISVILAALSLGYYAGGRLADRKPEIRWFYGIIALSGILVLVFYSVGTAVLPSLSKNFSLSSGALLSSILIFFTPAVLLGTLSPYAVKLQTLKTPKIGIGSVSGKIFFWSTMGSIFGSLMTGFYFIPNFGVNSIIIATGLFLTISGLIVLFFYRLNIRFFGSIVVCLVFLAPTLLSKPEPKNDFLYEKDGLYEKLTVYDGKHQGRPARFFQQDRSLSGAMFLDTTDPTDMVYDYTDYYKLYKIFTPEVENALVIGGGAYSIPKALLHELPNANIEVSEIEPSLLELSKKYFGVQDSPRLTNTTRDGRQWLRTSTKKYNLIYSDVYYSFYSVPAHFTTKEFFAQAKDALAPNGIFIANMIGDLSRQQPSLIMSEIKTLQTAFPNSYFFAVESPVQTGTQNIILVGFNSDKKIDFSDYDLSYSENEFLRNLTSKSINPERFELSPYPVLSDNYAPVDFLTSKLIGRRTLTENEQSGSEMLALIDQQLRYGGRYLSASGHSRVQDFITAELSQTTEQAEQQAWQHTSIDGSKFELKNIIGRLNPGSERRIILGTHYDSKRFADKDKKDPHAEMPGANDSASGTAVLLEVSRLIANSRNKPKVGIDFVFFDGEEGEENAGTDSSNWYPLGSTYFSKNLNELYPVSQPELGIIVDMVCEKNLNLYKEKSSVASAASQLNSFWNIGKTIAPNTFLEGKEKQIIDDHTPLIAAGIPSFLVIDIEYPFFHTTEDTIDKCSSDSLNSVAQAIYQYLYTL